MKPIVYGLGLALAMAMAGPASAQNTPDNNGRWWNQPAGTNAFMVFNPLTTLYGRIGGLYSVSGHMRSPEAIPGGTFEAGDAGGAIIGLGARLMPVLRVELQASGVVTTPLRANIFGSLFPYARVRSNQIFANLFVDFGPFFGNPWGLNPFVGGGVGVSWNTIVLDGNTDRYNHTRFGFAANATAGLQWQPTNNLIIEAAYRYLYTGRFTETPGVPGFFSYNSPNAHQFMLSLLVPFDGLTRALGQ